MMEKLIEIMIMEEKLIWKMGNLSKVKDCTMKLTVKIFHQMIIWMHCKYFFVD